MVLFLTIQKGFHQKSLSKLHLYDYVFLQLNLYENISPKADGHEE